MSEKETGAKSAKPYVMVRMTEEEQRALLDLAARENRSMAAQFRHLLQQATEKQAA